MLALPTTGWREGEAGDGEGGAWETLMGKASVPASKAGPLVPLAFCLGSVSSCPSSPFPFSYAAFFCPFSQPRGWCARPHPHLCTKGPSLSPLPDWGHWQRRPPTPTGHDTAAVGIRHLPTVARL